ncbi:MAG TPA: transcriptional repressor [Paludibacter sp.]|nr:transcriptional repressor [Paludibacter sp.]
MNSYIQTHQFLIQKNIKPSVQRTAVMEFLLNNRIHATVDEIYVALSPDMPTLSKTTVYNTLDLLVKKGAVQMLSIDEKNARYDADTSNHGHFFCQSCGKVSDIFNLNPALFEIPYHPNFKIKTVEISYTGICKECKEN